MYQHSFVLHQTNCQPTSHPLLPLELLLMTALLLPACPPTQLLLQEQQVKNSLVPGFVRATGSVVTTYFPPPRLPPGYVPVHRPSRGAEAALPAGGACLRLGLDGWA
jgi:hypothetical protein